MRPADRLTERYTYADYLHWPDEVRGELIEGQFYDMSPAPNVRHQNLALAIGSALRQQLAGKPCRVFIAPLDIVLAQHKGLDDEAINVVQPDVFIVCDRAKILEKRISGAPDFVLEILSPGTARKDQVQKLSLYERHGVRELWYLDPESRVLTMYAQENAEAARYGRPRVIEAQGAVALGILPELGIDWDEAFAE